MPLLMKKQGPDARERSEIMCALSQTRTLLNQAYVSFNTTCDSDLIESYV